MLIYPICFLKMSAWSWQPRVWWTLLVNASWQGANVKPVCITGRIPQLPSHIKIPFLCLCVRVCFWAIEDVTVSMCDNWPPPPLRSTPPLSAMLQSAKLLSVSLEKHMLCLSSHYLPIDSLFPLSPARSTPRRSAYISSEADVRDAVQ